MKINTKIFFHKDEEMLDSFFSLTLKDKKEFMDDTHKSLEKIVPDLKDDSKVAVLEGCIRLGEKMFGVGIQADMRDLDDVVLYMNRFESLSVDEYLDRMNENKRLVAGEPEKYTLIKSNEQHETDA